MIKRTMHPRGNERMPKKPKPSNLFRNEVRDSEFWQLLKNPAPDLQSSSAPRADPISASASGASISATVIKYFVELDVNVQFSHFLALNEIVAPQFGQFFIRPPSDQADGRAAFGASVLSAELGARLQKMLTSLRCSRQRTRIAARIRWSQTTRFQPP
jgi:hypothetical protein